MVFDGDACRIDDDGGAVGYFGLLKALRVICRLELIRPSKRLVRPKKELQKYECKNWPNTVSTNQHTEQISRHNLRMHSCANLTNPFACNSPVFEAAVQSKKVYPPRLSSRALAGIAARRGG